MRWLLVACLLLAGCALETDYIEVRHPGSAASQPVTGASQVSVRVAARDSRSSNRDRVSVKKNGYGMEMAPIVATNDVIAETRQAITREIEAQGFRSGGTDGRVDVEVLRFHSEFRLGFWSGVAAADLSVNVRVIDAAGQIRFAKTYTAEGLQPNIQIASGTNARAALEAGLQRLVQNVAADSELTQALLSLGRPVQPIS